MTTLTDEEIDEALRSTPEVHLGHVAAFATARCPIPRAKPDFPAGVFAGLFGLPDASPNPPGKSFAEMYTEMLGASLYGHGFTSDPIIPKGTKLKSILDDLSPLDNSTFKQMQKEFLDSYYEQLDKKIYGGAGFVFMPSPLKPAACQACAAAGLPAHGVTVKGPRPCGHKD